jgi:hypothetical protein
MENLILDISKSTRIYWGTPQNPTTDGDGSGRGILCRKQS